MQVTSVVNQRSKQSGDKAPTAATSGPALFQKHMHVNKEGANTSRTSQRPSYYNYEDQCGMFGCDELPDTAHLDELLENTEYADINLADYHYDPANYLEGQDDEDAVDLDFLTSKSAEMEFRETYKNAFNEQLAILNRDIDEFQKAAQEYAVANGDPGWTWE